MSQPLTHSPDASHLGTGAGTAAAQTAAPRQYADPSGYGYTTTPPAAPTLTGVTPATVSLAAGSGTTPTTLTLHGTGFKAGAVVKVDTPAAGASYSPVSHTLVDPTTMTISLALNDATSAGVWSFTVTEGSYTTPPATVTVSVA